MVSTNLKNMIVKLQIISPRIGVKTKTVWNHHLDYKTRCFEVTSLSPNLGGHQQPLSSGHLTIPKWDDSNGTFQNGFQTSYIFLQNPRLFSRAVAVFMSTIWYIAQVKIAPLFSQDHPFLGCQDSEDSKQTWSSKPFTYYSLHTVILYI